MQFPAEIRPAIEPLPWPMRFSDGRIRLTTARVRLLKRLWHLIPGGLAESRQALAAYQGGDVLDVGAFHGWYSVLLAPRATTGDRLVSFEPDPQAVPTLRAMIGDLRRVFPALEFNVTDEPVGDGRPVSLRRPAGTGGHPQFGHAGEPDAVRSVTVDAYVADHDLCPRLIKVDVEGAELQVLAGMTATLALHRPTIMLEVHPHWLEPGASTEHVDALMSDAGYRGETVDESELSIRQLWHPAKR